jgi:hypothetical protein
VDGKQDGVWSWWHANGTKAVYGSYQHGVPVGRWLFWKPDGELAEMKELPADGQPAADGRASGDAGIPMLPDGGPSPDADSNVSA